MFSADMRVGKHTLRPANVRAVRVRCGRPETIVLKGQRPFKTGF